MTQSESGTKGFLTAVGSGLVASNATTSVTWLRDQVFTPSVRGTREFFVWLGHHLTSHTTITWWVVWTLVILSLPTVWRVLRFIVRGKSGAGGKADWHNFHQFLFLGLGWRWTYDALGKISDLVVLCPFCLHQLGLKSDLRADAAVFGGVQTVTVYWCDHCQKERLRLDGPHEMTVLRAGQEIERLVRSGEWKDFVRPR